MRSWALLSALALAGCGGGNPIPIPSPTPVPTVAPTSTPTIAPTPAVTQTPQSIATGLAQASPPPIPDLFAAGQKPIGAQRLVRKRRAALSLVVNARFHGAKTAGRRALSLGNQSGHGQSGYYTQMVLDGSASGSYSLISVSLSEIPPPADCTGANQHYAPTIHPENAALETSMQYIRPCLPSSTTHVLRQFNMDDNMGYSTPGAKEVDFDRDPTVFGKYVRDFGDGVPRVAVADEFRRGVGTISAIWNASLNVWDRLLSYPDGTCTTGACGMGWNGDEYWWNNASCSPLATASVLDAQELGNAGWRLSGVPPPSTFIIPPGGACVMELQFTYAPGSWIAVTP